MFESFIGHVYGDGLLADSVDTTLFMTDVQQMGCSVKCTISERAEMTCVADALSLCDSWASCLHRRRRIGVEPLKLVIFHLLQPHFADIVRWVALLWNLLTAF